VVSRRWSDFVGSSRNGLESALNQQVETPRVIYAWHNLTSILFQGIKSSIRIDLMSYVENRGV
jgi:hypothetical protein